MDQDTRNSCGLQFKTYAIIQRAIEDGIAHGIRRAKKYNDTPTDDALCEHIEREIMNMLDEVVEFDLGEGP